MSLFGNIFWDTEKSYISFQTDNQFLFEINTTPKETTVSKKTYRALICLNSYFTEKTCNHELSKNANCYKTSFLNDRVSEIFQGFKRFVNIAKKEIKKDTTYLPAEKLYIFQGQGLDYLQ